MTPVELSRTVLRAMRHAVDAGELRVVVPEGDAGVESVRVERPRPGGCGDYATGVALRIARAAGHSPRHVAEVLSPRLAAEPGIAGVDITGPGFLNITLAGVRAEGLVGEVLRQGRCYGHVHPDTGQLAQIHVPGELRALVVADAARRVLRSQGTLVRVTCDEAVVPAELREALEVLGVRVDAYGRPPQALPVLRPVPVKAEPVPVKADGGGAGGVCGELGADATRWALLYPAPHDHPRVTPDQGGDAHLVQRESNPLFRVRYAHARSCALRRNAAALGFDPVPGEVAGAEAEGLLDQLDAYPVVLAAAARHRAPDRLARHLVATADAFLLFQTVTRSPVLPRGDEKPSAAHRARLALAEAAGTVLAGGLSLLGISAPAYL
ncbi:ArgS-related anticodon-binding protein NrtL [Streptomyces silaceus]|uniref:ArgS-related anticodon-binding protein NrtL n=1 Tax=Streptomyces silaceus TaxID=545123 RepID=UPI0006EBB247|nr:DALR anticodon-binding domain-containing protein [Streptomyces silaceus]